MAILGGAGEVLIERSEFRPSATQQPATAQSLHEERVTQTDPIAATTRTTPMRAILLKSRAKESWLLYTPAARTDRQCGGGLPERRTGGPSSARPAIRDRKGQNPDSSPSGMEGQHAAERDYVANNSMWWNNRRPQRDGLCILRSQGGVGEWGRHSGGSADGTVNA